MSSIKSHARELFDAGFGLPLPSEGRREDPRRRWEFCVARACAMKIESDPVVCNLFGDCTWRLTEMIQGAIEAAGRMVRS